MCLLSTVSAKGPGAVRLAVEELGRPPPPTVSRLKRDEPRPTVQWQTTWRQEDSLLLLWCGPTPLLRHQVSHCTCIRIPLPQSVLHCVFTVLTHTTCRFNPQLIATSYKLRVNERDCGKRRKSLNCLLSLIMPQSNRARDLFLFS